MDRPVGRFADRGDAGRRLARRLAAFADPRPVVVGLPRGGVVVAAAVADALRASLDVVVVARVACPWDRTVGLGAVAECDVCVLDLELIAARGVSVSEIEYAITRERLALPRRAHRIRPGDAIDVSDRVVIVVDDGLVTGATASAAIEAVRRRGARTVLLAVPVAPIASANVMRAIADEVVTIERPPWFRRIRDFYRSYRPVTDDQIAALLARRAADARPE